MAKHKVSKPGHETIAQERARRESEDVLRDLQASLAGDKGATTRAQHLRELRDMPRKPLHPLDIAAACFGGEPPQQDPSTDQFDDGIDTERGQQDAMSNDAGAERHTAHRTQPPPE